MASTPSAVVQDVSLVLADAKIRAPWTAEHGLKAALSPRSAVYDFLACSIFCFSWLRTSRDSSVLNLCEGGRFNFLRFEGARPSLHSGTSVLNSFNILCGFPLHRWCESISRRYSCSGILRSQQMNLQRWTNLSARMFRRACGPSWSPMPAHGITSMWKTYLLSLPGKSKHWCSEGVFNRSKSVSTSPIKMKSRIRSWSVLTVDFPFAQANL